MESTPDEIRALAERARVYVASPEGQKALAESLRRATEAMRTLTEPRPIDWRRLHEPFRVH